MTLPSEFFVCLNVLNIPRYETVNTMDAPAQAY